MQSIELTSIPVSQLARIESFVEGARAVLAKIPNASGNDPMDIDLEFRSTGNCHIYLLFGKWVGPHEAEFPDVHATA